MNDACSHLILMIKLKTGVTQFDCVCEEEACAGCIKDGWCPLYTTRMEMIKKYGDYLFNNCVKCGNKDCDKSEQEIELCMEDDKHRKADELYDKAEQMDIQEQTLKNPHNKNPCPILSRPLGPEGKEWDNSEPADCNKEKCPVKECPYDYCQSIRSVSYGGGYYCSLGNSVSDDRCKRRDKPCQYREDLKEDWYHV